MRQITAQEIIVDEMGLKKMGDRQSINQESIARCIRVAKQGAELTHDFFSQLSSRATQSPHHPTMIEYLQS